jgi:hypothetical protein
LLVHKNALDAADADDRSLNWWIVEAIEEKLDRMKPKVQFPASQFGSAGFTYMAMLTWNMPGFATGLPESDTDLVIDRMMTEICHVVRDHGATDVVTVDGPWQVQPLELRKTENFPEGTRPPDDTGSWVGDKAPDWVDN